MPKFELLNSMLTFKILQKNTNADENMLYPPSLSKVRLGEKKVRSKWGVYLGQGG